LNEDECIANYCKGDGTAKKTFSALRFKTLDLRDYVLPNRCESDDADDYVKGV
jgi:hypothetical protein